MADRGRNVVTEVNGRVVHGDECIGRKLGNPRLDGIALREEFIDADLNGTFDSTLVEPESDPVLAAALRSLPPRRRLILFLRYFADLSYTEIADVVGVSEGTVAATLAQARTALRAVLTEGVTSSGNR